MSYTDTFIRVAPDCPATSAVVPVSRKSGKPVHVIQYELLSQNPYRYSEKNLILDVHLRHKGIEPGVAPGLLLEEIRAELFSKPHPCLRACMLPKKYGWGVHYDAEGKIAIYAIESPEYRRLDETGVKVLDAMRSSRKSSRAE